MPFGIDIPSPVGIAIQAWPVCRVVQPQCTRLEGLHRPNWSLRAPYLTCHLCPRCQPWQLAPMQHPCVMDQRTGKSMVRWWRAGDRIRIAGSPVVLTIPACTKKDRAPLTPDFIYDCKQCTGLASSSIGARCLINGGTCEPEHDQWELVTWTMHIYIYIYPSLIWHKVTKWWYLTNIYTY